MLLLFIYLLSIGDYNRLSNNNYQSKIRLKHDAKDIHRLSGEMILEKIILHVRSIAAMKEDRGTNKLDQANASYAIDYLIFFFGILQL